MSNVHLSGLASSARDRSLSVSLTNFCRPTPTASLVERVFTPSTMPNLTAKTYLASEAEA
jgi:hypothetical protein